MAAPRFQIIELLYLTAAIGAGCGVAQIAPLSWTDGALVTTVLLIAPVTLRESFSLNHVRKSLGHLSQDQNFELRFLSWGRSAAVILLISVLCLQLLAEANLISLVELSDIQEQQSGRRARIALVELALLICIVSPALYAKVRPATHWRIAVNALAVIPALLWAMLHIWQETMINFLVYIAVRGVERAQRPEPPYEAMSETRFANLILACAVVAIFAFFAVNTAATRWWSRRRLRSVVFLLALGACSAVIPVTWQLLTNELPKLSPATYEAISLGPAHRWISVVALIGIVSCAWTYLKIRRSRAYVEPTSVPVPDSWPSRIGVPALVFVVYTVLGVAFAYRFFGNVVRLKGGGTMVQTWRELFWAVAYTEYFLMFANWLTALVLLVRAWRNRRAPCEVQLYGLPRPQFATLLILNLLTASLAGLLAAWSAFALWLTPWYRWFP